MNVPPVLDRGGIENEIIWHLSKIKKGLLKKGIFPREYIGTPLPKLKVSWRQEQSGKGEEQGREGSLPE